MKTVCFATLLVGLSLMACSGGEPSSPESAAFVQDDLLAASSDTIAATRIVSWEVAPDAGGTRVIGRSATGEVLADLLTSSDIGGCPDGGGALVTTTAILPAQGSRAVGCGGEVMHDSMNGATSQVVDRLLADMASASPPPAAVEAQALPPGSYFPPTINPNNPLSYCVPHTDTKCTLAVYWCKDTFLDCSTNTWHPCGACFGWKW
jgi:hypothetical protein